MNADEAATVLRALGEGIRLDPTVRLAARVVLAELDRLRKVERQRNKLAGGAGVDLVEFDDEDWDL